MTSAGRRPQNLLTLKIKFILFYNYYVSPLDNFINLRYIIWGISDHIALSFKKVCQKTRHTIFVVYFLLCREHNWKVRSLWGFLKTSILVFTQEERERKIST